jgi:Heterokaryon incompatibility protein (HET)
MMPSREAIIRYAPLTPDRLIIRVLVLLPDKSPSGIVRCELKEVSLDEKPLYEAISYCWGDPAMTRFIICNGSQLQVTVNLEAALRHLRCPETNRVLWADAICINQADPLERSRQVQIMRNIYEGAKGVLAWLGERTRSSQIALRLVDEFVEASLKSLKDSGQLTLRKLVANGLSANRMKNGVAPLKELLRRPWFHRLWVVQEVAVAGEVTIMCGQDETSWDCLVAVLTLLDEIGILTTHNSLDFEKLGFPLLINDARSRYQRASHKDSLTGSPLLTLSTPARSAGNRPSKPSPPYISRNVFMTTKNEEELNFPLWFRRMLATDPRDKLFALYGLTEKIAHPVQLAVDYKMSVAETYHQFAVHMLRTTQTLDILSTTRSDSDIAKGLPSWVADWSESSNSSVALIGQIASRFRATRESNYSAKFLDQQAVLVIEGEVIDKISEVGLVLGHQEMKLDRTASTSLSYMYEHLEVTAYYQEILASWERVGQQDDPERYVTGEDGRSVYRETLTATYGRSSAAIAGYDSWQRANWPMRLLARWKPENRPVLVKVAAVGHFFSCSLQAIIARRRDTMYDRRALNEPTFSQRRSFERYLTMAFGRRLARTEKGYLALVPARAKVGDSITLCKGGKTPLILRPFEASWELVGDSYVHGIMNGEAFNQEKCKEMHIV